MTNYFCRAEAAKVTSIYLISLIVPTIQILIFETAYK